MRHILFILLSAFLFIDGARAQSACAKAQWLAGKVCDRLDVRFDLSKCTIGNAPPIVTVRSRCWNGKGVAVATAGGKDYFATFVPSEGGWKLAGIRSEKSELAGAVVEGPAHAAESPTSVVSGSAADTSASKGPAVPPAKIETTAAPGVAESEHAGAHFKEPSREELPAAAEAPAEHAETHLEHAPAAAHNGAHEGHVEKPLEIAGLLDAYYAVNFNRPALVTPPSNTAPFQPAPQNTYRSFDIYDDTFSLNLAEISLEKEHGPFTAHLDLGFSHMAEQISPMDVATKNVLQGYILWKPESLSGFSLRFGKMFTYMGIEEVTMTQKAEEGDAHPKNWFYSRSLLFTYAVPLWHTGLEASYLTLAKHLRVSGYVLNNWNSPYENNRMKALGAQLAYAFSENNKLAYNYFQGVEAAGAAANWEQQRTVHDIYASCKFWRNWDVLGEYVVGAEPSFHSQNNTLTTDQNWESWQAALHYTLGRWGLGARYERFADKGGYVMQAFSPTGAPLQQVVQSTLASVSYEAGPGTKLYLEYRNDGSDQNAFTSNAGTTGSQATLTTSAVMEF